MPIKDLGTRFAVDANYKGKRKRGSAYTMEDALSLEADLLEKLKAEYVLNIVPVKPVAKIKPSREVDPNEPTLKELFDLTCSLVWSKCKSTCGIRRSRAVITDFFGWDTLACDITSTRIADMEQYYRGKGNSDATINRKKSAISRVLRTGRELEMTNARPFLRITKETEGRLRWLSPEEEVVLVDAAKAHSQDMYDFIAVLLDTGCRLGEIRDLDVDGYTGTHVVIHADKSKSGKSRAVPLEPHTRAILDRRKASLVGDSKLFRYFMNRGRAFYNDWDCIKLKAGLNDPELVPHCLRHTKASRLINDGEDLMLVKEWLGHRVYATTLRYAHLAPNRLDEAMARSRDSKSTHAANF